MQKIQLNKQRLAGSLLIFKKSHKKASVLYHKIHKKPWLLADLSKWLYKVNLYISP